MTKILLVEDDKSLREIYGVRLLAEGYDIVSAGDGEEALAMAIKERPALIVSDVMMPKISGFDMLDILRSTTETKDIKVIMMTALSSEDQRQRGEKLGADRYLVKSQVGIEDVVRAVHEVLGDLPGMSPVAQQTPQPHSPLPAQPAGSSPQAQASAAPQAPPPTPAPGPQPTDPAPLPQPTAPFSSSAPRPSNLGDRVIQPIQSSDDQQKDLAMMIERELAEEPAPSQPSQQPTAPQPPAPIPAPAAPQPQSQPAAPQFSMPQPIPVNEPPQPLTTPTAPEPSQPQPESQAPIAASPPANEQQPAPQPVQPPSPEMPGMPTQFSHQPVDTPPTPPQTQ